MDHGADPPAVLPSMTGGHNLQPEDAAVSQHIGIDLHKAKSFVTRVNHRGHVPEQIELPHANGALRDDLTRLPADARIAVKATGNWMWVDEVIEERHPNLVLAHPLKTNTIASTRIKMDKIDTTMLAQLLRADLVPAAYIPPRDVRDTRELLRYRASVVRLRTQVKNKLAAIVSKTGLQPPTRTTCGVKSQRFLATASVRPCYRLELDGYLRTLAHLTSELRHVSSTVENQAAADPQAQLLQTMPGIGAYSALLILSEIGDIHRFPDSRQFRGLSYRVAKKHGRNVGRVAVARVMLKTLYAMLTKQEAFRPMGKALPGQRPGGMASAPSR